MNKVTQEQVDKLFNESEKETWCVFGKSFVLAVKLTNGFTIIEDASCVDTANFDIEIGKKIAEERIKNKIWELEGYLLQTAIGGIK